MLWGAQRPLKASKAAGPRGRGREGTNNGRKQGVARPGKSLGVGGLLQADFLTGQGAQPFLWERAPGSARPPRATPATHSGSPPSLCLLCSSPGTLFLLWSMRKKQGRVTEGGNLLRGLSAQRTVTLRLWTTELPWHPAWASDDICPHPYPNTPLGDSFPGLGS